MLKNNLKITHFALIMSLLNTFLFHLPFSKFVTNNTDYKSFGGILMIFSLMILMIILNFFMFYLILSLSRIVGKILLVIFFIINAIAVYFVNTYSVIIDETMISNILNTDTEESTSFFSFKLILYLIFLGILPSIYIIKTKIIKDPIKKIFATIGIAFLFIIVLVFANASNWLWIDKNSKTLGGLAMPWCYTVNISLFYIHEHQKNEKEILLPNATIKDTQKSIVVLVIGESSRRQNYSLYGYNKNTNPLLSKVENLYHFDAVSNATYTTAGVKSILDYTNSNDLNEILPNYLYRNKVEVIWRTTNWGEPPVHIKNFSNKNTLESSCKKENCKYDEVLLNGLQEQILASKNNKILVILHTSTSHGPTYNQKYPPEFEQFKPVCNSVELSKCSQTELMNAYDNTIVYTDYILNSVIENLKQMKDYKSTMIFISDHGESLGEKNLYMHGMPMSIAPKEQYEIPFIVWLSDSSKHLKPNKLLTQFHVFHSVLNFLNVQSPIYNEAMNIYK